MSKSKICACLVLKLLFSAQVACLVESESKYCDVVSLDFKKQCFLREHLASIAHSPNQLAFDTERNTLYFSFDSGQGEYVPAVLNMGTRAITVLKGIKDAFAMAIDEDTREIYFGGSYGIYKYSPGTTKVMRMNVGGIDVWWLVIKKGVYFIKFPTLQAYIYKTKWIRPLFELNETMIHQFVFDNDSNVFFINSTGLFGVRYNSTRAILIRAIPRFLSMATDRNGVIYVCSEEAIYSIRNVVRRVKRIYNIPGVLGMIFDKDNNLIYSDSHDIYRLVPATKENYINALRKT